MSTIWFRQYFLGSEKRKLFTDDHRIENGLTGSGCRLARMWCTWRRKVWNELQNYVVRRTKLNAVYLTRKINTNLLNRKSTLI